MQINSIKGFIVGILAAGILGGCATQANKDPLEGLNRGIYKFNDTVDKAALKPVAGAYKAVVPGTIRTGVDNFFSNLGNIVTIVNDLLQFKFAQAFDDTGRFVINTTFGVGGLVDWASMDGIPRRTEDFGQTLAHWGWKDSAYFIIPLFGPSTLRDAGGFFVDATFFDPVFAVDHIPTRNSLIVTQAIDKRSQFIPGSDLLDEAALDPYAFMRDAYLQRRNNQILDGNVPRETLEDEDEYEADAAEADAPQAEQVAAAK